MAGHILASGFAMSDPNNLHMCKVRLLYIHHHRPRGLRSEARLLLGKHARFFSHRILAIESPLYPHLFRRVVNTMRVLHILACASSNPALRSMPISPKTKREDPEAGVTETLLRQNYFTGVPWSLLGSLSSLRHSHSCATSTRRHHGHS
jgi:hypothetical protein